MNYEWTFFCKLSLSSVNIRWNINNGKTGGLVIIKSSAQFLSYSVFENQWARLNCETPSLCTECK